MGDGVEQLVAAIDAALAQFWADDAPFSMFRDGACLWFRHPDRTNVLRLTVEELPPNEWPPAPPA